MLRHVLQMVSRRLFAGNVCETRIEIVAPCSDIESNLPRVAGGDFRGKCMRSLEVCEDAMICPFKVIEADHGDHQALNVILNLALRRGGLAIRAKLGEAHLDHVANGASFLLAAAVAREGSELVELNLRDLGACGVI